MRIFEKGYRNLREVGTTTVSMEKKERGGKWEGENQREGGATEGSEEGGPKKK